MRTTLFCGMIMLLWASCGSLSAQGMEQGVVEGTGAVGGIWINNGGGNHVYLGGTFGGAFLERVFVFGELGYGPLNATSTTAVVNGTRVTIPASGKLFDFGGGVQFILISGSKFEPYVIGAVGGGRFSASGSTEVPGTNLEVSTSVSDTKVRLGGGGGVRWYISENWGLRPELRIDRYLGDFGRTAFRYTVGVFYQFGK